MGTARRAVTEFVARHRVDAALVLVAIAALGPIVVRNTAQPASRIDLTAAVADHGSVDITAYPKGVGVDYSVVDGRDRSDKAPGQPLLAVPVYVVERAAGAEPAERFRPGGDLTLWWVTFWSATVPFAALLVLMRRAAARVAPQAALPVALVLGFGTQLMPFAVNLFAHVLAACLAYATWIALSRAPLDRSRALAVGALAGLTVLVEYEAAIVVVVLVGWLVVRDRRHTGWFLAGGVPAALVMGAYHWIAFGAPWRLPYSSYIGKLNHQIDMGVRNPVRPAADILVSPTRGLLLTAPVVLVAIVAAVRLLRRAGVTREVRDHCVVALVVLGGYVLWVSAFAGTVLDDYPGPRFVIAAIPFFAVPLAAAWMPLRRAAIACALVGGVLMLGASTTGILVPRGVSLFQEYASRARGHAFDPTVWSIGLGRIGLAVYLLTVAGSLALLARAAREPVPVQPAELASA